MPFTKEQQHEHYLKNKEIVKAKRRERYLKNKTPAQANPDSLVQPKLEVEQNLVANQVEQIVQPSIPEKNEVETSPLAKEKIIRENERFITYNRRLWDKKHQKYVYYSCADSCWNGKYCSNCDD